jgi:hypothetical protein
LPDRNVHTREGDAMTDRKREQERRAEMWRQFKERMKRHLTRMTK